MKGSADMLPDWPQPTGIFKDGKSFNALVFLQTVHDIYDTVTLGGPGPDESRAMEQAAFARMLEERLVVIPNGVLFRMFSSLENSPKIPSEFIETLDDGKRYLRVDCLQENDTTPAAFSPTAAVTTTTATNRSTVAPAMAAAAAAAVSAVPAQPTLTAITSPDVPEEDMPGSEAGRSA